MFKNKPFFTQYPIIIWMLMSVPIAIIVGSCVALFLWLLDVATMYRFNNNWLLYGLPIAGVAIYFVYQRWGKAVATGNNLVISEAQQPNKGIPIVIMPLILSTTIVTHLFGGSAGREGTAVQIGGSIANTVARFFKLNTSTLQVITIVGIAAGFGAVFGTTVAGAIFAIEVLAISNVFTKAFLPSLIASIVADITCQSWGIIHTKYNVSPIAEFDGLLCIKVMLASVFFGLAARLFSFLIDFSKEKANQFITTKWFIPIIGGSMVILGSWLLNTTDFLGLGVISNSTNAVTIVSSFKEGGANYFSWFWKLLFTVVTLALGFKGGEVTPLFFIGAALGNTIAIITNAPIDLMAAIGFVALFAAATNTPIASTIMAVELFGGNAIIYFAIGCSIAYYCSGKKGIYAAQILAWNKKGTPNS